MKKQAITLGRIGILLPIASIIGMIIIGIGAGSAFLTMSADGFDPENIQQLMTVIFESGLTIIGGLLIVAGAIIGSYFIFQALKVLAAESGVKQFRIAGLLYFIGSIGLLLFGIGAIVSFIGWIIHIVAYFSIQAEDSIVEEAV
jgi:uncharacterized membrane protein